MQAAEQAIVFNPLISQYEKRYILDINSDSVKLFKECCTRRIHIDGFVDEKKKGITFFNKPVYSKKDIVSENAVFLTLDSASKDQIHPVCSEVFVINEKLCKGKIMIYGAGGVGKRIFKEMYSRAFDILGFIDSDKSKIGTQIYGKEVYEKQILDTLPDDIVLVEAGKGCYEIDSIIRSFRKNFYRFYIYEWPYTSSEIWVDRDKGIPLWLGCILPLQEFFEKNSSKELVLYGDDISLAEKYASLYECLDFGPISLMTEKRENATEDVAVIEEILYKDDYVVLLYEEDERKYLDKLRNLGVERECGHVNSTNMPNIYNRVSMLDVNLGYTFRTNSMYPGIYIYGENRKEDYKIGVLGGSTTDSELDPQIRSWVEIMYCKYCKGGITLFNGAMSGYTSDQELLKLIRDMMKLDLDMVIVYDAFNDILANLEGKFWYLESLVRFAGKYVKFLDRHVEDNGVWRGILPNSVADGWLENIQYMHTVAECKGVRFFSFIQPMLCSKKTLDKHSEGLVEMLRYIYSEKFIDSTKQFREKCAEIEKSHSYITDLSYIFDDVDVYMDMCHVYECGNEMIAKEIWNVVEKSIFCKSMRYEEI